MVGEVPWVAGAEGRLVNGLDGGTYAAYDGSTVERVQRALQDEGLYDGPVHGALDRSTMEAVRQFQEENDLQPSGVPSPRTRELLLDPDAGER
jgi:peptidoglycan hydrolase-like protein with peptidoglycan-binding domain